MYNRKSNTKKRKSNFGAIKTGLYKSKLEAKCAELLQAADIEFEYETKKIVLQEKFKYFNSWERSGKRFYNKTGVAAITYTPDFVGDGWIIETKGHKTSTFNLKWKMFKKWMIENEPTVDIYLPTNHSELRQVIKLIQEK